LKNGKLAGYKSVQYRFSQNAPFRVEEVMSSAVKWSSIAHLILLLVARKVLLRDLLTYPANLLAKFSNQLQ
jgi:flagellar biosynthesis component FlhA